MPKGYIPGSYITVLDIPFNDPEICILEADIGNEAGTTFPIKLRDGNTYNVLLDTGAMRSVMNLKTLHQLGHEIKDLNSEGIPRVVNASGKDMGAIGTIDIVLDINGHVFTQEFLVCKDLQRPLIIGTDFTSSKFAGTAWTPQGTRVLQIEGETIIEVDAPEGKRMNFALKHRVYIKKRGVAEVWIECPHELTGKQYVTICETLQAQNPNLYVVPILLDLPANAPDFDAAAKEAKEVNETSTDETKPKVIDDEPPKQENWPTPDNPYGCGKLTKNFPCKVLMYNLSHHDSVYLPRGTVVAKATPDKEDVVSIEAMSTDDAAKYVHAEDIKYKGLGVPHKNKAPAAADLSDFITSPAQVEDHPKIPTADASVPFDILECFNKLCDRKQQVFSKNNTDIGQTKLIEMEIDTGLSPPVSSRPYSLALKHYEWVKKEIEILEKSGVIEESISPWASPIVVVPKKSGPGEAPRRRLCVDFRKINALQPQVIDGKTRNRATYFPLPKIDDLLARIKGAKIFSTLDLRSGYYHISLTKSSQPKTAFVTPFGKWQFKQVPFGLAQAPAYFQKLMNGIVNKFDWALAYLDDIIIFSNSAEEHLQHLEEIFDELIAAGLKLKREKCDFFKKEIHYLGHIISTDGIRPLPDKLKSIQDMPAPTNPKEIRQFLGLAGYYRKFVPRFADYSRALTKLTRKDAKFVWSKECEVSFQFLKNALCTEPILKYPDLDKSYTLFTDASKYAWAGVLTQAHKDAEGNDVLHPCCYVSGLFNPTQVKWAALTKEAYAIFKSYQKLTIYTSASEVLVRTDHKPLKKFLEGATQNDNVNRWALQLEGHNIKIDYIEGIKNTLADTLSRLIEFNPDVKKEKEPKGQEFGKPILPVPVVCVESTEYRLEQYDFLKFDADINEVEVLQLPIGLQKLQELQQQDPWIKDVCSKVRTGRIKESSYTIRNGILMKTSHQRGEERHLYVLPTVLHAQVIKTAHDKMGHNGSTRTFLALSRLYHWKNIKKDIINWVKTCKQCALFNSQSRLFENQHFSPSMAPMKFIAMDLIGEFNPPSKAGHRYVLTVVCMYSGYVFAVPLKSKSAEEVIQAYDRFVRSTHGNSQRILSDNGTEFKNKMWKKVAEHFNFEQIHSPIYRPQCNGKIESFHKFLKATVGKHTSRHLEWDEVLHLAVSAYNWLPNEHAIETPFFLMYARDPYMDLDKIIRDETRYMGDDKTIPSLQELDKYQRIIAENLIRSRIARDKDKKEFGCELPKVNEMILVKDHTAKAFEPKWIPGYRVLKIEGKHVTAKNTVTGHTAKYFITDVKSTDIREQLVEAEENIVRRNSRPSTLVIHKSQIPDLQFKEPVDRTPAETLAKAKLKHPFEQVLPTRITRSMAKKDVILAQDVDISETLVDSKEIWHDNPPSAAAAKMDTPVHHQQDADLEHQEPADHTASPPAAASAKMDTPVQLKPDTDLEHQDPAKDTASSSAAATADDAPGISSLFWRLRCNLMDSLVSDRKAAKNIQNFANTKQFGEL